MAVIYQTSKARSGRGSISPVPAAPASVTATKTASNEITLSWQDPPDSTGLQSYRVYRSNGGAYTQIGTGNPVSYPATQSFIDSGLAAGTYTYRVSCYSTGGVESQQTQSGSLTITSPSPGVVFGWKSYVTDPFSIGSYVLGVDGQYALLPLVDIPAGTTVQFAKISATSPLLSVDASTGVVSVPSSLLEGSYSISVSITDGTSIYSRAFTLAVAAYAGNWDARIAGPDVVWYHNFANAAEVNNFIRIPNDYAQPLSSAPGGYTLNKNITVGVHDPILHARQVADPDTSSGYALEITNIGSRLASDITPTQMFVDLVDASAFPNPANTPAKYYWLAIHADDTPGGSALWPSDGVAGSKGIKECVTVREKVGNRLYLAGRGHSYGEYSAGGRANCVVSTTDFTPTNSGALVFEVNATNFNSTKDTGWALVGGRVYFTTTGSPLVGKDYTVAAVAWQPSGKLRITTTAQATAVPLDGNACNILPAGRKFLAGTPIGNDSDGGWNRPFAALSGAINGRGVNDPAANGTVTVRTNFTAGAQGQSYNDGLYAQPFYKQFTWAASKFDGEEFWMQWRVKFSPSRADPLCPSGKQMWVDVYSIGANQEWVTGGPGWRDVTAGYSYDPGIRTYTNFGTTLNPQYEVDWSLGEWQTVMVRMRPGYAQDDIVPRPGKGSDTYSSLEVNTTYFTPTNDGTELIFETFVPPLYPWFPSPSNPGPNGETTNRQTPGYFDRGGWKCEWPTASSWSSTGVNFVGRSTLVSAANIVDYGGGNRRMRWTLIRRGTQAFPTGVPVAGNRMQLTAIDDALAYPAAYLKQEWDMWVKRPGQTPQRVYALANYITPMGIPGVGSFSTYPPCYNGLQATGYGNVWDNLAPRGSTTWTRWSDFIFSKSTIPWPDD